MKINRKELKKDLTEMLDKHDIYIKQIGDNLVFMKQILIILEL